MKPKTVTVFNEKENQTLRVDTNSSTVKELLKELNINSETVIITRNDDVLLLDNELNDNDTINLLSVISGG